MLKNTTALSVKDLVITGIFSALFCMVTVIAGLFFALNPVLTFFMPVSVAFFTGPVYMLLLAKVPRRGPTIILGIIMGLLMFVTGMYWLWSVAYIVLGYAAAMIAGMGNYRKLKWNAASFLCNALDQSAVLCGLSCGQRE